jgi:hypothetical protein
MVDSLKSMAYINIVILEETIWQGANPFPAE